MSETSAVETGKRPDMANRDTPLIKNDWYVACLTEELTQQPMRRTMLEQDIVMYRGADGTPIALQNRCAHRSFPLHMGKVKGDRIQCGYHGFEYGPDGRCAFVPSLDGPRPGIRIQAYPLVEVGPFVWIWTGDPEAVDHSKLIDQPCFAPTGWRWVSGYMPLAASYVGLHENLMDLTHVPFLHASATRGQTGLARGKLEVKDEPHRINLVMTMTGWPTPPVTHRVMGYTDPVTAISESVRQTPAIQFGYQKHIDSSTPPKELTRYIVHCMTPETQTKTHYYWAISRNAALENKELDEELAGIARTAFAEDKVALEAMEELAQRDKRPGFREMVVAADSGGVKMLRLLARWAEAEQAANAEKAAQR